MPKADINRRGATNANCSSYDIAPPFDGQVIKIHFVPGQFVEKDALLFTLDTTKENLELERDQARLLRAEAQLRMAELALKNNTELRKKNVVSERQFLDSEAQRDIAAAAAAEARVQVKADEIKIKEMKLYPSIFGYSSHARRQLRLIHVKTEHLRGTARRQRPRIFSTVS